MSDKCGNHVDMFYTMLNKGLNNSYRAIIFCIINKLSFFLIGVTYGYRWNCIQDFKWTNKPYWCGTQINVNIEQILDP